MAKKKVEEIKENIELLDLDFIMSDRFASYAKNIIQERALPDARDGLKPVQRRILYGMYYEGNTSNKGYRKSAKSVGSIMGNFHPHGDSSIYDAMVRLSQDWKNNETLVDMQGNNGSIDDDPAAAMRYTEARLSEISNLMLNDIDKDTVEWVFNFDDTLKEPTVLPAEMPLLLVNGSTGIAAGYATNIPPHNLTELIDAAIYRIAEPTSTVEDLMQFVKGPDFPTGGIIQGKEGLLDAYKTGKGRIVVRSKCEIEEEKGIKRIIVSEIPYEVVKSNMVKKIDEIRINKDIDGINDVRDESDRNGFRIVIELKRDVDADKILKYLYKNTDLQIYYNFNMVAIVNHRPVLMTLEKSLDTFINFRKEIVLRRSKFLKDKKEARCHTLEGLIKAISILDAVIETIRSSKDKADSKLKLQEQFGFTEAQAESIVTLQLYRLSNTDVAELKKEYTRLNKEISELKQIIKNESILTLTIINELKDIKERFVRPRKTKIEANIEDITLTKEEMISNERVMVTVTRNGYLKKVSTRSYASSSDQLTGFKDDDAILGYTECDSLDYLVGFISNGNYFIIPVYELDDGKWKDIGKHYSQLVKCEGSGSIVDAIIVKDFNTYAFIIFITKTGYIKKTPVNELFVERRNKAYPCMKFRCDDELVSAKLTYENEELLIVTENGLASRYSSELLISSSLKSTGSKGINIQKDDGVAALTVIKEDLDLLLVTQKGLTKRIHETDLEVTNRPVKGYRVCKLVKSNPQLITSARMVKNTDSTIIYNGTPDVLNFKDVPLMDQEAGFSDSLKLGPFWMIADIKEVEKVDFPEDYHEDEFEQIDIFTN